MMNRNPIATLSNLFVFVACALLVASLLVPVVIRKREAARSTSCLNNLRQIGLGYHNYHSAYKQLPAATGGTDANPSPELSNAGRLGPLVSLLPFLENQRTWEIISNPYVNSETGQQFPPMGPVPWYPATKYEPWGMSPDVYHCPGELPERLSAGAPKTVYTLAGESDTSTTTSYVACYGDGTFLQAEQTANDALAARRRRAANRGIFFAGESMKFRDVLDGLSNTLMTSEVNASLKREPGISEVARDIVGIGQNPLLCLSAPKSDDVTFWPFGRGALFSDGFLPISGFQTVLPPNSPSCTSELGIEDAISSASSKHPGGVNVLMADGAVRFASNTIDTGNLNSPGVADQPGYSQPGSKSPYGVWGAMGSRASREIVDVSNALSSVSRLPRSSFASPQDDSMTKWTDKSGKVSLMAEMVQIIDEKTIQLRAANGTIHEVPLNQLKDKDIYQAVRQDVLHKQNSATP